MDPFVASMFQAFSLSMQQQQSNNRKEALATKALQAMVNKIDQFDGRNISRYLRCYIREIELNRVSEKKMVELFGLATIPEIRDHITSFMDHYGNSWEVFSHALKDEYFLEDADRISKKLFLEWIERPNKNLQATELLREFERERRKDRSNIPKTIEAPKAPVRTTPPTMPIVQPSTSLSKKADMGIEEIIRGIQDLQIKLARLEENTSTNNLKNVSKQRYKEVLRIVKKEFDDVIIDSIKRKRQLMDETGMSHTIDVKIYKDEEEVDIGYKQPTNEKNGYNQRVRFEDYSDKKMETLSHYTRKHWTKVTTKVLVKVRNIEEPIVALVDYGFEINLISKNLYEKQKWPIDMEHGWAIRAANNTRGKLCGACSHVKIWIGDVATEQHFFIQDTTSYPLILGQPYITSTRMETKVLDDGSTYAREHSKDGRKVVQFLTVPPNHERNRDRLRAKPLPKIVEGFKDFGEVPL
uniref:Predicted protein n=1 Tax=Physcomitrium patens TaxID=3218 RepID=A9U4L8_PHYPA